MRIDASDSTNSGESQVRSTPDLPKPSIDNKAKEQSKAPRTPMENSTFQVDVAGRRELVARRKSPVHSVDDSRKTMRVRQEPVLPIDPVNPLPSLNVSPAVAEHAQRLVREAITLAARNATYSSRARFIRALKLITYARDAQSNSQRYSHALSNGLQALKESRSFHPNGSRLESRLDLERIVSAHETPVLRNINLNKTSPLIALQRYHSYAEEQLADAVGSEEVASEALFGLAKLHSHMSLGRADEESTRGPIAMSLYQAALMVNPNNFLASNELGVLFARYGQLRDAREVLIHAAHVDPRRPEVWRNLSAVHSMLGETELAKLAHHELELTRRLAQRSRTNRLPNLQWVDPATFSKLSRGSSLPHTDRTQLVTTRDDADIREAKRSNGRLRTSTK